MSIYIKPGGWIETRKPTKGMLSLEGLIHGSFNLGETILTNEINVNWARGLTFTKVLTEDWTMTFSNPVVGKTIMIVTTGAFDIIPPAGFDVAELVNYDNTGRNVIFVTCVSTELPLYAVSDKTYAL